MKKNSKRMNGKNGCKDTCSNIYMLFRLTLCDIAVFSLLLLSSLAVAGQISIPWVVDLTIPSNTDNPPFEAGYTAVEFNPPGGTDRVGLEFVSSHQHSYTVQLPFQINISAPDTASPGQFVKLNTSAVLAGAPLFKTSSDIGFNTNVFADKNSFTLGQAGITNTISYGGVSLNVAGNKSYVDTDSSADGTLTRTNWRNDPWGAPLQFSRDTQFSSYQLSTTGSVDAWGGKIALLEFAGNVIPPPVGTTAKAVSKIMDLEVGPQFNIVEKTYLTTQFVTGFYTADNGKSYDDILINGANRSGYLQIPTNLTPGDDYKIQMTALGLGFRCLFEYLLQGNIDIDAKFIAGLFNVDVKDIPVGSEFTVDSWVDRFQYVQFLTDFMTQSDFLTKYLSFDILGGLENQNLEKTSPPLQMSHDDSLIASLIGADVNQGQQRHFFAGDPPSASVTATGIPEPTSIVLISLGLLGLVVSSKKYKN